MPGELSGGEQQRVALARSIASEPSVLLMDEPLSNLDALLRESVRIELKELQRRLGITMIYITHDQREALALADELIVMRRSSIAQRGKPENVYHQPVDSFVAGFLGAANLMPVNVLTRQGSDVTVCATNLLRPIVVKSGLLGSTDRDVFFMVRPEDIEFSSELDVAIWSGTIQQRLFQGDHYIYVVDIGGDKVHVVAGQETIREVGIQVHLALKSGKSGFALAADSDAANAAAA